MRVSGRLLVGALVFAVGLVACGTTEATKPGMPRPEWAEQASAWFGNYDAALDAGTGQHALLLAPDVVIDSAVLAEHRQAVGRRAVVAHVERVPPITAASTPSSERFCAAGGVITHPLPTDGIVAAT